MSLIQLDREDAKRSLYRFVKGAWAHCGETSPFSPSWHLERICRVLQQVSNAYKDPAPELRRPRRVINVPPGTGKSKLTGVFWPAWDWIENPWRRWMYISFDVSLLNRDTRMLTTLLQSEWYQERWGNRLKSERYAVTDLSTLQGGQRFNTTFEGKGTGRHAHIQVIDDPIKPKDAQAVDAKVLERVWDNLSNTFASRTADAATFARLMIMQRLGEDDPAERAIKAGWESTCFPMEYEPDNPDPLDPRTEEGELLCPERFPQHVVDGFKTSAECGPDVYETQYQQRPAVRGGQIIKEEWIENNAVTRDQLPRGNVRPLQSWDLTFKDTASSDFVSGQYWYEAWIDDETHYFLADEPLFERLSFVDTLTNVRSKRKIWRTGEILVEDKANGPAVESVLRKEWPGVIKLVNPEGSKLARLHSVAPLWSEGRVHLLRCESYERMKRTFMRFPRVRRDDEVDSMTQVLRYASKDENTREAYRKMAKSMRR